MSNIIHTALRAYRPARSAVKQRANYRGYKADLRLDFKSRCGYCDDSDEYFGGSRGSQIDHFAPKSRFPELELNYRNLVYSCPFCNRAKSNKWVGDDSSKPHNGTCGFVDPCELEYEDHLIRDVTGKIIALTKLGDYILKNLNLQLIRHQYIWQAQKLDQLSEKLDSLRQVVEKNNPLYLELTESLVDILLEYRNYRQRVNEL